MKTNISNKWPLAALTLGLGLAVSGVQAQHISAGALSTNQGSQLSFVNAAGFVHTSGYVQSLSYSNSGTYAGFYNGSQPVFEALAQTSANGGMPHPAAAAFGSFLELRLETVVSGPAGGTFAFWEDDETAPTFSLSVGQTQSSGNLFALSDASLGAGAAGADPFGHLHGRRFSADLSGDYLVGFRLVDTSVNGFGGGPIHTDSDLFLMTFRAVAVPEPTALALVGMGAVAVGMGIRRRTGN